MALTVPVSQQGIQNAQGGGGGVRASAADFDNGAAQGWNALARGIGALSDTYYNINIRKRQEAQSLELINDVQAYRNSSAKFIDEYQQQYQGASALDAEAAYMEWNQQQVDALKTKWEGIDSAQLYLAQHAGPIAGAGLNSMRDYGNGQLAAWKDQTYQGEQSILLQQIAADPINFGQYINSMVGNYKRFNSNAAPELVEANANLLWNQGLQEAFSAALSNGDLDTAISIFQKALTAGQRGAVDFSKAAPGTPRVQGAHFALPTDGHHHITSPFGRRAAPQTPKGAGSSDHKGIDLRMPVGTPIKAISGGEITFAGDKGGYGVAVVIKHDDGTTTSQYGHLSKLNVRPGMRVNPGDVIALSGNTGKSTGPHLDLKVTKNGQYIDPAPLMGMTRQGLAGPLELAGRGAQQEAASAGGSELDSSPVANITASSIPGQAGVDQAGQETASSPGDMGSDGQTQSPVQDQAPTESGLRYGGLAPLSTLQKMQRAMASFEDSQIKEAHNAIIAKYQEMDLNGDLTEDFLLSDADFQNLPYTEKMSWLKIGRGEAGRMGQLAKDTEGQIKYEATKSKKTLEGNFYSAAEIGDIPRTRAALYQWYADNNAWDYFTRADFEKHLNFLEKEAGRVNEEIDKFLDLRPEMFPKPELKRQFRHKVAGLAHQHQITADSPELAGLLENRAVNGNYLKGDDSLPGQFSRKPAVREKVIDDMLSNASLPKTETNKRRADQAVDGDKSIAEVMAPDAGLWKGKGRATLKNISRSLAVQGDIFEQAGNSHNVDPNWLMAIAEVVSSGEKFAKSKLRPDGVGLMQIGSEMAQQMGLTDETMFDPRYNIFAGAEVFSQLLDNNDGDYAKALADYAEGMPEEEKPAFIKEVRRVYNDNFGLLDIGPIGSNKFAPRRYQLPKYGER